MKDFFVRGILPAFQYRYFLAISREAVTEIWRRHNMAPGPALLTGEAAVAAFLLASRGTKGAQQVVGLHFECSGPVDRLMAFGTHDGGIRGYVGQPRAEWEGSLMDGKGVGMLTVNRFQDFSTKIYSSTVEFRHQSIARNIEEFIGRSEQVQVFLFLGPFSTGQGTGIYGLLLEAMPGADADKTDALLEWVQSHQLDARLSSGESIDPLPDAEELLRGEIKHFCDCSQSKIEGVLFNMGKEDALAILAEHGCIEVTCEFCMEKYVVDGSDVERIFLEKDP